MHTQREKFWKSRSKKYEKLQWAIKSGYLHAFLDAGAFNKGDHVLDIGTGTGIIAHTISPHVERVVGIDISPDMLSHAFEHRTNNEEFVISDARAIKFDKHSFSKVTARMVFHHILEDTQKAMDECFRVLKNGGKMIFSEGVPPSEHVKPFYKEMFKLKEDRLTFMEEDMAALVKGSGFTKTDKIIYWLRQASIKNWLQNSNLHKDVQDKIMKMHLDLDDRGKKDYNMKVTEGDVLIDMKFVILISTK